jgi:5'-methylthioadenosine phosphorylase
MAGLADVESINVSTPFGNPSDQITLGNIEGCRIAFLPRHGRGHILTPTEVPYRANIYALKTLGVRYIVAVSACGSLREAYRPDNIVIPDQLIDHTRGKRDYTFFGRGLVAHVGVPEPFSSELSDVLFNAVRAADGTVHKGAYFITVEGPRFSTKGESNLFRLWGMDLVGMTTSPEAFLAAEAEIAYACMAHVTDYDVWHGTEEPVSVEMVIRTLAANTAIAQEAIRWMARHHSSWAKDFSAHSSLKEALSLIENWNNIPEDVVRALSPIIKKYI